MKKINEWWDDFDKIKDNNGRIAAIRKIAGKGKEFYQELDIGTAFFEYIQPEFQKNCDMNGYAGFLESIRADFPDMFAADASWHVRHLIKYYICSSQPGKTKEIIGYLINNPLGEQPDVIFDIMDFLIINGFTDDVWKILEVYYPIFDKSDKIIPAGVMELSILSSIFIINKNIGLNGEFDLGLIKKELEKFDYSQKGRYLMARLNILSKSNYVFRKWSRADFQGKKAAENLYYLTLEFARFLSTEKKIDANIAGFLQYCLENYLHETEISPGLEFNRQKADEYLVALVGMFSLSRTRAFITLCSIRLFYEFLDERQIIDNSIYSQAMQDIEYLKECMFKAFKKEMWKYRFAEKYLGQQKINEKDMLETAADFELKKDYPNALHYVMEILGDNPQSYHALYLKYRISKKIGVMEEASLKMAYEEAKSQKAGKELLKLMEEEIGNMPKTGIG